MLMLWVLCGGLAAPVSYILIPVSVLLLFRKGMIAEMLIGFFIILVLSDSRQEFFAFAAKIKDVYMLLLGLLLIFDRKNFQPWDETAKKFIPFFALAGISLLFSEVFLTNVQKTISYVLVFLVVPNYFLRAWRNEKEKFIRDLIVTGTLLLLAGLILRPVLPDFVTLKGRYNGVLGNPNGMGLYCMLFMMMTAVCKEYYPGLFRRYELWAIYGIVIFSLYLCGSRSSLFGVVLFFFFRSVFRFSPIAGFIVFLTILFLYYLISSNIATIITALNLQDYFRLETFESGSGRVIAWEFGWEQIAKEPMLGKGIGYTDYFYRKNYALLSAMGHQGNAHNSYITFWLDTGVFGLLAFVVAFVFSFIKGAVNSRSAIPALYAILFSAFFESWLTASLNPFTIQALIMLTLFTSPAFNTSQQQLPEEPNAAPEAPYPVH